MHNCRQFAGVPGKPLRGNVATGATSLVSPFMLTTAGISNFVILGVIFCMF